jgi:sialidase-1
MLDAPFALSTGLVIALAALAAAAGGMDEMFGLIVCPTSQQNPRNSEASMVDLRDGRLLLAYSEFYGADSSDHAKARIAGKVSSDGGRTWSDAFILQDNIGGLNVMSVSLLRLNSGELAMVYLVKNSLSDCRAYLRKSADEGQNWSEAVCCTPPEWYHCVNNDRVVQLSTGRILVPASHTDHVERNYHFRSCCYYSDDGGATWQKGADVDLPGTGADEPAVVELTDGRVMMLLRTDLGRIYACHSSDGGATWTAPAATPLVSPSSPASIKRLPTGDLLIVWNNSPDRRVPLTVALSSDDGETWHHVKDIETEPCAERLHDGYAYTSILPLGERVLLTYYVAQAGGRWALKLTSLPVSWLYE